MYLATLVYPISMPSLSSSPWIRGAPHRGLAMLISRTKFPRDAQIDSCLINPSRPIGTRILPAFERGNSDAIWPPPTRDPSHVSCLKSHISCHRLILFSSFVVRG